MENNEYIRSFNIEDVLEFLDDFKGEIRLLSNRSEGDIINNILIIKDGDIKQRVLKSLEYLRPIDKEESLTAFEDDNAIDIAVTLFSIPLEGMVLKANSDFYLVRKIARWRLKKAK